MTEVYDAVYAVPLDCDSCVDSVSQTLSQVKGIDRYDVDLKNQLVKVTGSIAPSTIIRSLQESGKDAIIRGSGRPNSAAVAILESFDAKDQLAPVKGLARMVGLSTENILIDITLNGLSKGTYYSSIRSCGNISQGALSTGKVYYKLDPIVVNEKAQESNSLFFGQNFVKVPLSVGDLIGRSLVVSTHPDKVSSDSLCGVIARSAGVWQNDKQVCNCTGKTIWQERSDAIYHGIKM